MKLSISARRVSSSSALVASPLVATSISAAACEFSDAAVVTPVILDDTSRVPAAASCTLRVISCVAAPCCSTALAIADDASLACSMVRRMLSMAVTAAWLAFWMDPTCWAICLVALAV